MTAGRAATFLVLAGVAVVAAAAAIDALRGRESAPERPADEHANATAAPAPPPLPEPGAGLVARLRGEGLTGLLVLVTPECRVHALALPVLRARSAAPIDAEAVACAAPSLRRVGGCGPGLAPDCLPALRPDGVVAVVRDGGLWSRAAECPRAIGRCSRELLSADDLRRTGVGEPRVVDHVWLSPTRVAVLLSSPGGGYVLGVYDDRTLIASHRWGGAGPGRLEAAPGGALFTARPGRVFRADGTPLALTPPFRNARAIEWSPDGTWAAVAVGGATVLVPTAGITGGSEARRAIRLPYPARDLAWWPR